jgi:hypothetical protein
MRLPTLKRDTSAALDRARADLTALATAIAELQQRRDAALAGDDDVAELVVLDREADEQGLRLRALQGRIGHLESRLASEHAAQRATDYKAAVAKIEIALPRRAKAAEGVERALANLANATKEFMLSTESILKAWPPGVEWPPVYPAHALSLERLGALIAQIFTPARGHADRRPATPGEYLSRACDADRPRGFAQRERELQDEFVSDLKTVHDSPPVEDETNSEQAA